MSNEYDAAVTASLQPDTAQAARVGFAAATDTNPDAYAEAKRVARRTGVPVDTVFAMPVEIKRQDAVGSIDFDALAKTSPSTAALLSDVEKAKVAHDDVDNLSKIESALYAIGKWEVGTAKAVASSAMKFNEGAWGVARAGAELLPDFVGAPLANKFAEYGRGQRAMAAGLMPKGAGLLESSWYSGMQSLGLNLMQLPLGLGGKMAPVLTSMGLTTGGQAYGEARDKGISVPQSLAFGTSQGVIEAGTEMIGMPALFGMLKPGQFGAKALEYLIKEQGGEQIATHLQDLNEWAVLNPEKSFNDYLEARPAAAVQTALATAFGGGGQVAIMKGVELYVNRGQQAQQATQTGELLVELNKMAEASKLTQRDTETAQGFFQSVLEDGRDAVYITPEALAQSGLAEKMAQAIPSVAEQLGTAAESGHDIRIPIADLMATMAGPELEQSLLPHVAIDPGGFTTTTAQEYLQSDHAKELQAEVERVLGEQQGDDTFKASAQAVKTTVKDQLTTAGRFTESVNDAYSSMVGNFYAVQAARTGTTPEEMFKRYPLRIGAESVAGQQFDQSAIETPEFRNWFGESKVVDADGKPLVVYRSDRTEFNKFDKRKAKEGFFFHSSEAAANMYGGKARAFYLKMNNPLVVPNALPNEKNATDIKGSQFDGVVNERSDGKEYIVTDPTQIKSATGNNGNFDPNDPNILNQSAFHGTPYKFDKFSLDHIGKGEGAQAFGWGLYFAGKKQVAEYYRKTLSDSSSHQTVYLNGQKLEENTPERHAASLLYFNDAREIKPMAKKWIKEAAAGDLGLNDTAKKAGMSGVEYFQRLSDFVQKHKKKEITFAKGQLYEVSIPEDDDMLQWHKPIASQPESVKKALKDSGLWQELKDNLSDFSSPMNTRGKLNGENIYAYLEWKLGSDKAASLRLNELGISGLKYPAGSIAGTGTGNGGFNYVVFDESAVDILQTYYQNEKAARGSFNPATLQLTLLKNADLSTFLHESGHFFLEVQADLAGQLQRDAAIHGADTLKPGEQQVRQGHAGHARLVRRQGFGRVERARLRGKAQLSRKVRPRI
jgi:hypothetical protein